MLYIATLLTLAAYVAADETFQLTAKGSTLDTPVTISGTKLTLKNGSVGTFTLETPAGYLEVDGKYVTSTPNEGLVLKDKADASSSWGYEDNKLRLGATGSGNDFYACPDGDSYYLQGFSCTGGEQVDLYIGDAAAAESTTTAATTSAAPETSSATPETTTSEAPETTTSEAPETTSAAPETTSAAPETSSAPASSFTTIVSSSSSAANVTSFENGAAHMKAAAGAFVAIGALLL